VPARESIELTSKAYREFADYWASDRSPIYRGLCLGVANDPDMLSFLAGRPQRERQPNLLLAAVRWLWGLVEDYPSFRNLVLGERDRVTEILACRRTQTNEPARCAALLPFLARLPQPLALLEVGAAGGLCLLPDRYSYRYHLADRPGPYQLGRGRPIFDCRVYGDLPLPKQLPEVVWRKGVDLNPIDLNDDDAIAWLRTLIWPGEHQREQHLLEAVDLARRDPPPVVEGDLLELLPDLAAEAPKHATLVVFHAAVLVYLSRAQRARFRGIVERLPGRWLASEGPRVLPDLSVGLAGGSADTSGAFVVCLDGQPAEALMDSHGAWVKAAAART
jgi:hypothetical protein